ncbi:MAG: PEP-CTERM sorting domain-containing protein [Pontiella sp.]
MNKNMIVGAAALWVAGAASAALVTGFDQRYQADDYNTDTGIWTDSASGWNATATGTFGTTTTANGSTAVVNTGAGTAMGFTRGIALGGAGYTIQAVIRIDDGNTDLRQGPIAMGDGGWGGVFMGAQTEADGNVRLRGGNQAGSSGANVLQIDSTMTGVTDGMWGVYTLVVDATDGVETMTASFNQLDGTSLFMETYGVGLTADVGQIDAVGQLFGGEYGQGDADSWLGAIADVIIYNSALSTLDLATNEAEFQSLYVAAIPEPATLGLIAIFGGGMLFIRRYFRN